MGSPSARRPASSASTWVVGQLPVGTNTQPHGGERMEVRADDGDRCVRVGTLSLLRPLVRGRHGLRPLVLDTVAPPLQLFPRKIAQVRWYGFWVRQTVQSPDLWRQRLTTIGCIACLLL